MSYLVREYDGEVGSVGRHHVPGNCILSRGGEASGVGGRSDRVGHCGGGEREDGGEGAHGSRWYEAKV